jgi:hypothetical protein
MARSFNGKDTSLSSLELGFDSPSGYNCNVSFLSGVAQLAERLTVNQNVVGPSPTPGAR